MSYQWVEDDFDVPDGVGRLGLGKPADYTEYIMYHGTSSAAAQSIQVEGFRQSTDGMLGRGVYLSRVLDKARFYPLNHPEWDRVVIRVRVNVGKVITINHKGHPHRYNWHYYGYDTAWVQPGSDLVRSGLEVDCVWDPSRIQILNVITPRRV